MLLLIYWSLSFILFFSGILVFISNRKHLLITLLSLEFIVLSLFLFIFLILNLFQSETYFCVLFLVMSVCEGVLGISILITMIRTHGNDYFQSFGIL
uniref:NADH-ubiquinone oxidoreductase chain 4L n=1 Tax=Paracladura trichoptera TaxID=1111055 RepID=G8J8K0_9DIPT|nr:NADH dehydrogenase subunit 4L [Paracladura trichoptera]AET13118.1 NADH dehydrogenase subunit 4L [Paracladura trichoptera]